MQLETRNRRHAAAAEPTVIFFECALSVGNTSIIESGTFLREMIILTNLQATATCKHEVPGVHTELRKYQIY